VPHGSLEAQQAAPLWAAAGPDVPAGDLPRRTFSDGYIDWLGYDEDNDPVEGTAEIVSAVVDDQEMVLNIDYDEHQYVAKLTSKDAAWRGTFKRFEGGRFDGAGRCDARAVASEDGDEVFEGRWIEDDEVFKWKLVLRTTAPAKVAKERKPQVPPLERYTRMKVTRLAP
jgi:hypothetical protein